MTRTIHTRAQLDLLDWRTPETVVAFDPMLVRANSYAGRLSRAISISLDTCGRSRVEVAERMGAHLGGKMSLNILNAYASVARESHQVSVTRFDALIAATGDRRLLEFVAADHGWAVIERRHLPLIDMAILSEQEQILARRKRLLRASVRGSVRG